MSRHGIRVVIAGGGVAALETMLALRELAGHRIELTVVCPERSFLYRPVTVAEAFGRGEAREYPLGDICHYCGDSQLIWDALAQVDSDARVAVTATGERISYDALVVTAGAIPRDPLPGALTFAGRGSVAGFSELLDDLVSGSARSVVMTMPSEQMWPLPIYELALMTAGHLREHSSEAKVLLVTPEEEPLELFGPAAARAIEPMLQVRGIKLRTGSLPALIQGRTLTLAGGSVIVTDRVVTMPVLEGPRLSGLPSDAHGFIPTDHHGRVRGVTDVYAAGDVTAYPLKQGGLATQQADAVAESIAAELGLPITPRPFRPVLRGLLMTGGAPLYLRSEPQRLRHDASVAIDASPRRWSARDASSAAGQPLWWPPAKIAGRYLGPFLATARPQPLGVGLLADRAPVPGPPVSETEYEDALGLALLLADCDARWGDYSAALEALEAAEALEGALPHEYEEKRRQWRAAEHSSSL
jgi:sulfide:quinone oxidoreductase